MCGNGLKRSHVVPDLRSSRSFHEEHHDKLRNIRAKQSELAFV